MRILIVSPRSSDLYQNLSSISAIEPNIWAGLLANAVRDRCDVSIHDMEVMDYSDYSFYDYCRASRPDLTLFVVTGQNPNASSAAMDGAVKAAQSVQGVCGKIAFVGPHVNALPLETLNKHDFIDIVFTNEGVYALKDIAEKGCSYEALKTIDGIYFRNNDEIVIGNPGRIVPQNRMSIDMPGVAYDLMPDLGKYRTSLWHTNYSGDTSPFASIYTSLGCIFKCNFCMINSINRTKNGQEYTASDFNTFRYWEPEFLIKQFDYLASKGVKNIKIADEMFVLKPKHFMGLCDLLIERDYGFNIWAYTRVDTVKEQYLEKLKGAGINWLALGIESGNQSIRREITKGKFEELDIRDVVSSIKNSGINTILNYIVGLGSDTRETMQETLNLALELLGDASNIYCATALPGSPLYLESLSKGIRVPEKYSEYGFLSYDHVPNSTPTLSSRDVLAFRDYAFEAIHKNRRFLSMIESKFGVKAVENINKTTSIKLKRKLLGD